MFTRNLYANLQSSFIHNSPKLETIQMFFSGRVAHKLCCLHTMDYYSAAWRTDCWCTQQITTKFYSVKKSQSQKVTYYMLQFVYHFWKDKIIEMENRLVKLSEYPRLGMVIEIPCVLIVWMSLSWLWCPSFVKHHHWEALGKGYSGSHCILFYNFVWMYNFL